jgi:prepilin-type processing-associated H-X9-DG protein
MEEQGLATKFNFQKPWYDNVPDPANPSAPTNLAVVSTPIKMFTCPSTESGRVDETFTSTVKPAAGDYGSVNGVKSQFYTAFPTLGTFPTEGRPPVVGVLNKYLDGSKKLIQRCKIKDISDGTSKTVFIAEDAGRPTVYELGKPKNPNPMYSYATAGTGWADPDNGYSLEGIALTNGGLPLIQGGPLVINATNDSEVYSFHVGGAQFAFADGSAHFVLENIDPLVFMALVTRAGGENIPAGAY